MLSNLTFRSGQRTKPVARFADRWDMTFPDGPSHWEDLNEVLLGHCDVVGRDRSAITRSVRRRGGVVDARRDQPDALGAAGGGAPLISRAS
jgi:hypothetical protein